MTELSTTIISAITFGSDPVVAIYLGNDIVWPRNVATSAMTNVTLHYSVGDKIYASGSNYAYITGTLTWYIDGQQTSQQTVTLTPSAVTSNVGWSVSGTEIHASNRGIVTGNTKTSYFRGLYGNYQSSTVVVSQEANTLTIAPGGIETFEINGVSGSTSIDGSEQRLYVTQFYGYRMANYTSGASTRTYGDFALECGANWVQCNDMASVDVDEYMGSSAYRSTVVTARDTYFPSVFSNFTIRQYSDAYTLTVPGSKNILYSDTGFSISVTSKYLNNPLTITGNMITISSPNHGITVRSISDYGNGVYNINFNCRANTATTALRTNITIDNGYRTGTCIVRQDGCSSDIEFIDVKAQSGNWVIGTVTTSSGTTAGSSSTYPISGVIIARNGANELTGEVSIDRIVWQTIAPVTGATPTTHTDTNQSTTVVAEETVTCYVLEGGYTKTYYGKMWKSPQPNLQINEVSGFWVNEIIE